MRGKATGRTEKRVYEANHERQKNTEEEKGFRTGASDPSNYRRNNRRLTNVPPLPSIQISHRLTWVKPTVKFPLRLHCDRVNPCFSKKIVIELSF
jgi:hypothetical protein